MFLLLVLIGVTLIQPAVLNPALETFRPFFTTAGITAFYWLLRPVPEDQTKITKAYQNYFIAGIIIAETLGYLFYDFWLFGAVETSIQWLKIGIIYILIANIPRTVKHIKSILWMTIIGASYIAGYAIQIFIHRPEMMVDGRLGAYGMYEGANDLALILLCAWPIIFKMFEIEKAGIRKAILLLLLPVFAFLILLTISRGAMLSLVTCSVLCVFSGKTYGSVKTIKKMMLIGLFLMLVIIVPAKMAERPDTSSLVGKDASAESRINNWKAGVHMMISNPFGVGSERFSEFIGDFGGHRGLAAHNTFIKVGGEAGFLGLYCYLGMFFITIKQLMALRQKYKKDNEDIDKLLLSEALLISLIGFMIATFFTNKDYEWLLYINIGTTVALTRSLNVKPVVMEEREYGIIFVSMIVFFALIKLL